MQHNLSDPRTRAFTLIELSIVLVIIGLIVSGVLVGRSLIIAAQLRQTGTQIQKFQTATNTFRMKYNCIAGDCTNATSFWSANSNGCPMSSAVSAGTTCNGDGNGVLGSDTADYHSAPAQEYVRHWEQLSLSTFIPNKIASDGYSQAQYGYVTQRCGAGSFPCPAYARGSNSLVVIQQLVLSMPYAGIPPNTNGSKLYYMISDGGDIYPAFTPNEAKAIDVKSDDGLPFTGNILTGYGHTFATCATGATQNSYVSSDVFVGYPAGSMTGCNLMISAGF